ncbi:hypothetical protein ACLMJK_003189 [Lecanora helva]
MVLSEKKPPKLLILPEVQSPEARIITLAHPRSSKPSCYYFDSAKGVYEFTRIAAPRSAKRSWLISKRAACIEQKSTTDTVLGDSAASNALINDAAKSCETVSSEDEESATSGDISAGHVITDAELLVATPIDYLFLLLPSFTNSASAKGLFLSADDLLEKLSEQSKHFDQLTNNDAIRRAIEERINAVCDSVDAGDEKMYRLNEKYLLEELLRKAKNMGAKGLPASMYERFVRKALESPIGVIKRDGSLVSKGTDDVLSEAHSKDTDESQDSTVTSASENSAASISTEVTVPDATNPINDSELHNLMQIRTALSYLTCTYISPSLASKLESLVSSEESPINFKSLNERLAELEKLRAEALAARSLSNLSRKRNVYEDDEAAEANAEKKRKKDEEEKKKKANESRSLRELKKVDTKGMKKMSDFFGKGAVAKNK